MTNKELIERLEDIRNYYSAENLKDIGSDAPPLSGLETEALDETIKILSREEKYDQ